MAQGTVSRERQCTRFVTDDGTLSTPGTIQGKSHLIAILSVMKPTEKIWHNGRFIDWNDAKIHVLSHVVSYGSSVFEGIRCYKTGNGPAVFRLREHMRRMIDSAKIYRMEIPFNLDQLCEGVLDTVGVNGLDSCYIRPIALRGYGVIGVQGIKNPTETYIACWE